MDEIEILNQVKEKINTDYGIVSIYNIQNLEKLGLFEVKNLPYSIKILLESILRNLDGKIITKKDLLAFKEYNINSKIKKEIPFIPTRIILQDFTGVPAMVDLAALRSAVGRLGEDPSIINPLIPIDLVIDHSIQVDCYGDKNAQEKNEKKEFERNKERYIFLKWAQSTFINFRVIPPSRGIIHQINLEYLASVINIKEINGELTAFPDTLIGTDSHTTMINSLGILGWGVGGIEAEAVMLGQPYYMNIPEIVGVKLIGVPKEGITATDIILTITHILRKYGVVDKFIEFYGPGLQSLNLADRATIANMAPEYGATIGFFPIDDKTLDYLMLSGRELKKIAFIKQYLQYVGLFYTQDSPIPQYKEKLEIDLSEIRTCLAGPRHPQEKIELNELKLDFFRNLEESFKVAPEKSPTNTIRGLNHGSIVMAAITSCTNTSNPSVIIGAGLLAKKAVEKGLRIKNYIKTSFAPGSRVVADYLHNAGLLKYLETLGFHIIGYGCTTCIGNSGSLSDEIIQEIQQKNLVVASIISGNRNFEGRIHPYIKANYLSSPPLVIAFALAGTIIINLNEEPLGTDLYGNSIYLRDIWPSSKEIQEIINKSITPKLFKKQYKDIFKGNRLWDNLKSPKSEIYQWNEISTYIREPPFFVDFSIEIPYIKNIENARILAIFGNNITTDHISPAGSIPLDSPAGKYLIERGVEIKDFNSSGSRRGNHEVMIRGTFGNIMIKNKLTSKEGGWTIYYPNNEEMPIYDAVIKYKKDKIPLIIFAGKEYGTGSSRDWAAKGTALLGVKAVIAESFERIHRSNLVGMGVLPIQFREGDNIEKLGLIGNEIIDILELEFLVPLKKIKIRIKKQNTDIIYLNAIVRLDTPIEVEYYTNKGILSTTLRNMLKNMKYNQ